MKDDLPLMQRNRIGYNPLSPWPQLVEYDWSPTEVVLVHEHNGVRTVTRRPPL